MKILNASGKQMPSISILEAMKMLVHSWSEVSETTCYYCFQKAGFKEGTLEEDDDLFSVLKISVDQLPQRDENLVPNDFNLRTHVNG